MNEVTNVTSAAATPRSPSPHAITVVTALATTMAGAALLTMTGRSCTPDSSLVKKSVSVNSQALLEPSDTNDAPIKSLNHEFTLGPKQVTLPPLSCHL